MSTTTPTSDRTPGMVQAIVIRTGETDSHLGAATAAAAAAVACFAERPLHDDAEEARWTQWLDGAFTKVVRRAKPAVFDKLTGIPGGTALELPDGTGAAIAFPPGPLDELPPAVRRLQVSGTNLPNLPATTRIDKHEAVVVVDAELGMSTGKTCAQVAHGLLALAIRDLRAYTIVSVQEVDRPTFLRTHACALRPIVITDAGRTELEPGTDTVLAFAV